MNKITASNAYSIKQSNRSLIINTIRKYGRISRADLSNITGLTRGGVTPIIADLINLGLIREWGISNTTSGRKPILLEIDPTGCKIVSIDFTRENYLIGLVDLKGDIISMKEYQFGIWDTLQKVLDQLIVDVEQMINLDGKSKIIGISVVAPGPLDYKKGIILSPPNFWGWANIHIQSILEERFHIPVFLDNDANAYALAEKNYGMGKEYSEFVHVAVNEGIGAGIIKEGKLLRGNGGFGSEVGHITINMEGSQCACGNNGCLEIYAAIPKMVEQANLAMELGSPSKVLKEVKKKRDLKWEDIIRGLSFNDPLCMNILKKEAEYLGNALITLINLLEPQAIILGSKLAKAGSYIAEPLRDFISKRTLTRDFQLPDLLVSNLPYASLLGGSTLVLDHFISGGMGDYEEVLGWDN